MNFAARFLCIVSACLAGVSPAAEPVFSSELDGPITSAASYEPGQSVEPFRSIEEAVRQAVGQPAARQDVEARLLKLLAPTSALEARVFACKQLGVIGSAAALPELAKLLSEPETAGAACLALSTYPAGRADQILRDALHWAGDAARVQIINTLGDRRDANAVDQLLAQASNPDPAISESAIAALGKIATPSARKAIASLRAGVTGLKPVNPSGTGLQPVGGALADAMLRSAANLLEAGDTKKAAHVYEDLLVSGDTAAVRRSALAALLRLDTDGGERRIMDVLSGEDVALKPVAIAAVSKVPSRGASEKFGALLHHLRPDEQALLVENLAFRQDDAARLIVAKSLSSQEPLTRRAAITALGETGDPYFLSLLARSATMATEPEENRAIENALSNLKGGAATDARLAMELKTSLPKARVQLLAVILRRQGASAISVLLEEADSSDPTVAKAAYRGLAKVAAGTNAPAMLAKLSKIYDAGVRSEAESALRQVLGRVEPAASRSALICASFEKAANTATKISVLSLLPLAADASALAALNQATGDPENQVREAAVRSLAEWPDASGWDSLLVIYRQRDSANLHGIALPGLVRLAGEAQQSPDAKLAERYRALLTGAWNESDLKLILGGLAGWGNAEALTIALPLLSNPAVRAEAIAAVRQIAEAVKAHSPQVAEEAIKRLPSQ